MILLFRENGYTGAWWAQIGGLVVPLAFSPDMLFNTVRAELLCFNPTVEIRHKELKYHED